MGNIRVRKETGTLLFDFFYRGHRCREQTRLEDSAKNRQRLQKLLDQIETEILEGTFEYARRFPGSRMLRIFQDEEEILTLPLTPLKGQGRGTPLFEDFTQDWFEENEIRWKRSYRKTIRGTLNKYLIPTFGDKEIGSIVRSEILKFRSSLAKVTNGKKEGLSPDRINHIMTPLRMILDEAADRFEFNTPFIRIKPLKVPPSDVDPFSIEDVLTILAKVRSDFQVYYTVRFFTGLRTGEIDGLKWPFVDFEHRVIRVRETLVDGLEETTKTPGSVRDVWMSTPVYEGLQAQWKATGHLGKFVFCTKSGEPLDHRNVTKRVWYPLLRYLGMKRRKPYQT